MLENKLKILVVDDSREFCEIVSEFVNMQPDMEVIGVAHNGETALEMISRNEADIVLMDIIIPVLDGQKIFEIINKAFLKNKTKFIVLSAVKLNKIPQSMLESGAVYCISKPVDLEVLVKTIRNIMPT